MSNSLREARLAALVELGRELMRQNYVWTCPSQGTQTLVNSRFTNRRAFTLADLFGWNREGTLETLARQLPSGLIELLQDTSVLLISDGECVRSRVRFSSYADTLFAQPAWPDPQRDDLAVGPDSHRFGAFIARELPACIPSSGVSGRPFTMVNVGCGNGAAGIVAARLLGGLAGELPKRVLLVDRNESALRYAEVNARLADLAHFECRQSDILSAVHEPPTLVLANPPGLIDGQGVASRHGGGELGTGLALKIVDECLDQLLPGGALLMCAVAPVVRGVDVLRRSIEPRAQGIRRNRRVSLDYQVLETDVFSSELARPGCADVERLSMVGVTLRVAS
jgi:SAM-dependent methyltransferase